MKTTSKVLLFGIAAFIIASCHHHDPLAPSSPNTPNPTDTTNSTPTDSLPNNPGGSSNNPSDTIIYNPGGGNTNPTDSIPDSGSTSGNSSDSTFVFPTDSL